ncbi:SecY-interacting protein [Glaciecola siphonariae]|uniref:SecY-interacting protein n=1 Tax=Glaciecola siphonariae TaxID=521012 RepID=A0ABV9LU46_9ALTE
MTQTAPAKFVDTFDAFVQDYIDRSTPDNRGLLTPWDAQWPSQCVMQDTDSLHNDDIVQWQPARRQPQGVMSNLEQALELKIPDAFEQLLGRYYSLDLNAVHKRGNVTLLQAWNEHDYERLQKNIIAHVLMKRRLKQPDTLFFALTDEDDLIISIELESAQVILEPLGQVAREVLAGSLEEFMSDLSAQPQFVSL